MKHVHQGEFSRKFALIWCILLFYNSEPAGNLFGMRMITTVLAAVAIGYAGIAGWLYWAQESFVYFPDRKLAGTPANAGMSYKAVTLVTEDGLRLNGWFVPAARSRGTLLFNHGNAGNISHRLESIRQFRDLGLDVFIYDYRGYGESEGKPSEEGTYRDAEAAWRYLTETHKVAPERLVYFGRSLGAGVASRLAIRHPPRALIVESAFTSVPDFGAEVYPWLPVRWLARLHYPTRDNLRLLRVPVLVIHSRSDEIIPFRHGEALYAAANEPKELLEIRGGHNDGFLASGKRYTDGIDAFLRRTGL
jgi:fermentation-respiration switch protein FrsA (DUF1100 family)